MTERSRIEELDETISDHERFAESARIAFYSKRDFAKKKGKELSEAKTLMNRSYQDWVAARKTVKLLKGRRKSYLPSLRSWGKKHLDKVMEAVFK
jgi:hypothetical protein